MWERHCLGKNQMTWSDVGGKECQMTQGFRSEWLKERWYHWKIRQIGVESCFWGKLLSALIDLKIFYKTNLKPFLC